MAMPSVLYLQEAEVVPSGAARVARDGKNEKNSSVRDGWMYNRCEPGGQNGNPGPSRIILTVMSKSCSCDGTNENCMFCFGTGIIDGPRQIPPSTGYHDDLTSCPVCGCGDNKQKLDRHLRRAHGGKTEPPLELGKVRHTGQPEIQQYPQTLRPNAQFPKSAVRPRLSLDFVTCKICCTAVRKASFRQHMPRKHHVYSDLTAHAALAVASGPAREAPRPNVTAVPPHKLKNEILQQKLARALDASRDFAHNFGEEGRYGSHPAYDDYDDESKP